MKLQHNEVQSIAKQLMEKYDIPTAAYKETNNKTDALAYIDTCEFPIVLKKDGLAAGKGVIIANNIYEAREGIDILYSEEKGTVVFEQFLEGEEFSLMTLLIKIMLCHLIVLRKTNVRLTMMKV